jgi:MYXO-CTERM domain-containing protein
VQRLSVLGLCLAVATLAAPAPARACGGCFHVPNPTGTPTSVNAHRMVIVVAPGQTILWDQIVYEGDPGDFVWVLPVAPGTRVELADNAFFEALTAETQITMRAPLPPRTFCPDPCGGWLPFADFSAAESIDAGSPFVRVEHQGVVGPYETATIASDDPSALLTWLDANGYLVDDALLPTLAHYTAQRLSFAVLRLSADARVDRMQPVRVAMAGTSATLPLRMVAAGAGVDLDLELFVFAESRMEVVGYGNAEVDRGSITYDWASATFDYDQRFEDALFAGDAPGSNWVAEYAMPVAAWWRLESFTSVDSSGISHAAGPDVAVVRAAFLDSAPVHLTRLRTRLRPNDIREDLTLRVSSGGEIGNLIEVTRELNRAPEPVCAVCESSDGLSPGGPSERGRGSAFRCAVGSEASGGASWGVVLLGLVALGLRRSSRASASIGRRR